MFSEEDVVRSHKRRLDAILNIVILSFVIVLAQLWYLQIYRGEEFYQYSLRNRLRKEVVKAPRGMIFSRNNELMVHNIPRFDAVVTPQYLKNKNETLNKLSQILEMERKAIDRIISKNRGQASYRPIVIKKNLSLKEVAVIETENSKVPGVSVQTFISREYKDREVGGHLFGYIGEITKRELPKYRERDKKNYSQGDFIGKAGIEQEFDNYLRGEDGFQFMEVDARGRMRRVVRSNNLFAGIENKESVPGNNIRLTIDRDMQLTAYKALEGKVGSVVAVDVETGEILTMVSRPSFDPTKFSKGLTPEYWSSLVNNENNPLRDRSIQEHYSPGSTFKTISAIAALEENIVTPNQIIQCGPTFRLGRRVYHDWKRSGHGPTDVYKSLKQSVDVYYYKIATQLDIDVLSSYAKRFGLGQKTGIRLPREITGLMPTREWKKKRNGEDWQKGETVSCIIGQSYVLATPLQLAMAYAAIANGGKVLRPNIIREVFSNSGEIIKKSEPEVVSEANISKETLAAVSEGLNQVVNAKGGTAWWYRGEGIRMVGKTGTSQVRSMTSKELFSKCKDMPYRSRHHGLFVGYAPYKNPRIAVAAVVEHGCSGSSAAAPVARDVVTTYMKKYEKERHEKYALEDKEKNKKIWLQMKKAREAKKKKEQQKREQEDQRLNEEAQDLSGQT
ncbi:MAG: penicillin-binding protein 2 [Bacteriovoracaceae bacterium]